METNRKNLENSVDVPLLGTTKPHYNTLSRLFGVILAGLLSAPCYASDFSIGYIAGSYHFNRDLSPRNEQQDGIYGLYKWFAVGRYENTMDNTSYFIGGQWKLSTYRDVKNFVSVILADGYRGHDDAAGDYLIIPSIKMHYGYGWLSVAPKGLFFGLETEF